jgi:hypothetical protein
LIIVLVIAPFLVKEDKELAKERRGKADKFVALRDFDPN